ncbi:hypothetical protein K493DRAFT_295701 [Basidiobolus meristosporus CBS 931.73]|uniref:DUF4097 domain-containing protein n=1 Tax=Basidiobolus meristosporus CBS 931.73 TaxID=1314790 RepID=A0A1Y1ZA19_9FUNG|nr:hypothetical protein K493DRAFT_295701 [Basidiobolus meristosporus CBS 931.73]|eukprot:ORY07128.1 hypothetical protein K493DRAFT_295701 [Basidiobolus meristosporus CBS 931.73]
MSEKVAQSEVSYRVSMNMDPPPPYTLIDEQTIVHDTTSGQVLYNPGQCSANMDSNRQVCTIESTSLVLSLGQSIANIRLEKPTMESQNFVVTFPGMLTSTATAAMKKKGNKISVDNVLTPCTVHILIPSVSSSSKVHINLKSTQATISSQTSAVDLEIQSKNSPTHLAHVLANSLQLRSENSNVKLENIECRNLKLIMERSTANMSHLKAAEMSFNLERAPTLATCVASDYIVVRANHTSTELHDINANRMELILDHSKIDGALLTSDEIHMIIDHGSMISQVQAKSKEFKFDCTADHSNLHLDYMKEFKGELSFKSDHGQFHYPILPESKTQVRQVYAHSKYSTHLTFGEMKDFIKVRADHGKTAITFH